MMSSAVFPDHLHWRWSIKLLFTNSGAFSVLLPEKLHSDQKEPGKIPHNSHGFQPLPSFVQQKGGKTQKTKKLFSLEDLAKVGSSLQLNPHPSSLLHSSYFFHLPDYLFKPAEPGSEPEPLITLFNTGYVQKLYLKRNTLTSSLLLSYI